MKKITLLLLCLSTTLCLWGCGKFDNQNAIYTVRFVNENGIELYSQLVKSGEKPSYLAEKPMKDSDNCYDYSFSGWNGDLNAPITKNKTFTAKFDRIGKKFNITFETTNGAILSISKIEIEYGENYDVTSYKPKIPSGYEFKGWKNKADDKVITKGVWNYEEDIVVISLIEEVDSEKSWTEGVY